MVRGDAIEERMRTARVLTNVAANSTGALATWVWHIVISLGIQGIAQMEVDESRLYDCSQVIVINLKDAVHTGENDHNTTVNRDSTAAQACSRATWHHRYSVESRNFNNSGNIFCSCRHDHNIRCTAIDRSIIFIEHQIIRGMQDITRSQYSTQFTHDRCFFCW